MIRKWDITDEAAKRQCLDEVLARINEQGDAEFGIIGAEEIIDIVAAHVGPQAYNVALADVKKLLQSKLADLEIDIDVMRVVT